jgi:hypothetical protein
MIDIWSGRNAALYVYCPRVFHRVMVDGIALDPSLRQRIGLLPVDPAVMPVAERLTLTSRRLGITDTIELAEMTDHTTVPRLLRSNAARQSPATGGRVRRPEVHAHDAFLLSLHAILLDEVSYTIAQGRIYYAADNLTITLPLDGLIRVQSLELLEKARACAAGLRPEHACDGCQDL